MKKILLCFLLLLLPLTSCQTAEDSGLEESLIVFDCIEGDLEKGFSVKGIPWGSSFEEIQALFPDLEFTLWKSSATSEPIPLEEGSFVIRRFHFTDETRKSLYSIGYVYQSDTREAYDTISEKLYASAREHMPDDARGVSLSELESYSNNYWDPVDNSTVMWSSNVLHVTDKTKQPAHFITIYMPRELPKSLAPE